MGRRSPHRWAALAVVMAVGVALSGCTAERYWGGSSAAGQEALVGLVTKTDTNPYFVQLREAAHARARERGVEFAALAGRFDGDNAGQVTAIENLVQQGATTILITPNSSTGVLDAIESAREQGVLVLALDTATEPPSAVDATIATDNVEAGRKQGRYLEAALGDRKPRVLMIDGTPGSSVDTSRHNGFLQGFGLRKDDPRILATQSANGDQNKAQEAMENLLQRVERVNVVYTMNEPSGRGAFAALKDRGMDPLMGSIDGGCQGVQNVRDGKFDATVMQFPAKMARLGVDAAVEYSKTGKKPSGFVDTGSVVITDDPVPGVPSKSTAWGMKHCWGDS